MLRIKLFPCSNFIAVTILSTTPLLLLDSLFVLLRLLCKFRNCLGSSISLPTEILASRFTSLYIDEEMYFSLNKVLALLII